MLEVISFSTYQAVGLPQVLHFVVVHPEQVDSGFAFVPFSSQILHRKNKTKIALEKSRRFNSIKTICFTLRRETS